MFTLKALATGALLLVSFLPLFGRSRNQTSQSTQAQTPVPLRSAQLALQQGKAGEAIQILSQYLKTHPEDARARTLLGQSYAAANQMESAEEEFQTVIKDEPDNYVALSALGEIYERSGQLKKADSLLARAVKASHGNAQIRMEWAVVLTRLHEYQKAQNTLSGLMPPKDRDGQVGFHRLKASIALGLGNAGIAASEMEEALALKPEDVGLILGTAAARLQARNWRRAADLSKPIYSKTKDPSVGMILLEAELGAGTGFTSTLESLRALGTNGLDELEFRQHMAELLVSHGKFAEAIDDFKRAVELAPNRADLLFNLALAQFKAGRLDDALTSAQKCKEQGDTADLEDLVGDIQEARADNLAAVTSYQAAVVLAPDEEKYRLSLALELLKHKSFDAAKAVLQQTEGVHPNSWRVQFALGMLEYLEGKEEEATPILLRAGDLSPDPGIAFKYVGDIQMDRAAGPDPAVVSRLCKFADQNPKQAMMQYYCGALLFRRDYAVENKANMPDILQRLSLAARQLPSDAGPHCQLGRAYRWLEEWEAALKESEICVRLDPDSAQSHYRLAQIYHHEGQTEKAKQEMSLFSAASKRVADENARRDETMKTFLFTIQKETPDHP